LTEYTNFVIPIKLWDYLSYGKPVVATAATETARILQSSQAGVVTPDTAPGIADGLLKLLLDEALARSYAANARAFAVAPDSTWGARAATVIESLGVA